MAKIIKTKKQFKHRLFAWCCLTLSLILYLCSSIFLKSYNVTLAKEASIYETAIKNKQATIESLQVSIKELENRDRILGLANEDGIQSNQENVKFLEQ
ncbi:MAG: cell division protein FtsL [Erysipelotrichaceae bacterium]